MRDATQRQDGTGSVKAWVRLVREGGAAAQKARNAERTGRANLRVAVAPRSSRGWRGTRTVIQS
jgi:hypothetical protein